ncbi:uncharacterized protein LOC131675082 [Phymastichus coffea]|uniref:uncharacterized protein LOC131675082 n=1 Tax=Phymastichus coffea TaxID=108790 RepID=UPI00273BB89A|nr:uncharacterized protein LOC131675082 [Phymastichus coffea]
MPDQEAETVARAFYNGWICRFGTPLRVTTDQGRQFESYLFNALSRLTGTTHLRTSAYHPAANGMIERVHRQLKAAIRCHENDSWTRALPTVLLGIRAAWRENAAATAADIVYGQPLCLPGELLVASTANNNDPAFFVTELRNYFTKIRPVPEKSHGEQNTFIFKDLETCKSVLVRRNAVRTSLQMPYDGPFLVLTRSDKTYKLQFNGHTANVSIDRLKPAFVLGDAPENPHQNDEEDEFFLIRYHQALPQQQQQQEPVPQQQQQQLPTAHENNGQQPAIRRSTRRVRFAERYQAGFN